MVKNNGKKIMRFRLETKRRRGEVEEAVLASIKAAGLLAVALVAPKAVAFLLERGLKKQKRNDNWYLGKITTKLIDRGLIIKTQNGLRLSQKGETRLSALKSVSFKQPRRWDGKYRVVVFDIEEGKKKIRDFVRRQLVNMGFIRLQNSVWIGLYDCEELIGLMKTDTSTTKNLIYMTVESIENDELLRKRFGVG